MGFIDRMKKDSEDEMEFKMEGARIPVRNMLKKGLPLNLISELLGVEIEVVKALEEELNGIEN
ncbi:MAG: hypothetical protein ACRC28_07895 [Clostridium sp.]|uniref:hypothetical protein n=1 Tax=Clostridium sp. TaxID=1506 RepID=UPI003F307D5C